MRWYTKLIIVAVAALLGFTFYLGWWDFGDVEIKTRQAYHKTKDTLNTKAGIGGKSVGTAEDARICRENLKRLESAKREVADLQGRNVGTVSWEAVAKRFPGGVVPQCPAGGEYNLNPLGQLPQCSIGSNAPGDQSDNHVISGY